ncbi:MAG: hypothetical protein ACPGUD_04910 [Parashewanella sp.]
MGVDTSTTLDTLSNLSEEPNASSMIGNCQSDSEEQSAYTYFAKQLVLEFELDKKKVFNAISVLTENRPHTGTTQLSRTVQAFNWLKCQLPKKYQQDTVLVVSRQSTGVYLVDFYIKEHSALIEKLSLIGSELLINELSLAEQRDHQDLPLELKLIALPEVIAMSEKKYQDVFCFYQQQYGTLQSCLIIEPKHDVESQWNEKVEKALEKVLKRACRHLAKKRDSTHTINTENLEYLFWAFALQTLFQFT